jgi:23S rRNA-/tRNA-specific pseudouridylate synthase
MRKQLKRMFEARKIEKRYWALINGSPSPPEGELKTDRVQL